MDQYTSIRRNSHGWIADPPARLHTNILFGSGKDLTPANMVKYGITHVINCAYEKDSPAWFRTQYPSRYICLNADDSLDADIREWYAEFEEAMDSFRMDSTSKTIYVHCQCGINRSGFLTLMYICKKFNHPCDTAIKSILRQRPSALTNRTYMKQAHEFLNKYNGKSEQESTLVKSR